MIDPQYTGFQPTLQPVWPSVAGLFVYVAAGSVSTTGNPVTIPSARYAVSKNATNYIFVNLNTQLIVVNTTGFTGSFYPIATAVTNSTEITTFTDVRPDVFGQAGAGSGTVTSVAVSTDQSWLTVSGSPITTTGTIAINGTTGQTANQFVCTPNGSTGEVGLRAIVSADIPATLTLGVANTTAGLVILEGGTSGAVTLQTAAAAGTWVFTLPTTGGTNGYVLSTNGSGTTTWVAQTGGGGGNATSIQGTAVSATTPLLSQGLFFNGTQFFIGTSFGSAISAKGQGAVGNSSTNDFTANAATLALITKSNPSALWSASTGQYVSSTTMLDPTTGFLNGLIGEGSYSGLVTAGTNNLFTGTYVTDSSSAWNFLIFQMAWAGTGRPTSIGNQVLVSLINNNTNGSGGDVSGLLMIGGKYFGSNGNGLHINSPILNFLVGVEWNQCGNGVVYQGNGTTVAEVVTYANNCLAAGRSVTQIQGYGVFMGAADNNGLGNLLNDVKCFDISGDGEAGKPWNQTVTTVALTSNVATITVANTYAPGQVVRIKGCTGGNAPFNGRFVIATASATQFTVPITNANIGSNSPAGVTSSVYPGDIVSLTNHSLCGRIGPIQMYSPQDITASFLTNDGTCGQYTVDGYYGNSGGSTNEFINMSGSGYVEYVNSSFQGANEATALWYQDAGSSYMTRGCTYAGNGTWPILMHIYNGDDRTPIALQIENGTLFDNANPTLLLKQVNVGDTGTVIQIVNNGTGSNDIAGPNWTIDQGGVFVTYAGNDTAVGSLGIEPIQQFVQAKAQAANWNAGTAFTLIQPTVGGSVYEINAAEFPNLTATTATLPSLTIAWTDRDGVARTNTFLASTSTSASSTYVQPATPLLISTNGVAAVTATSAAYAAGVGTALTYDLIIKVTQIA